MNRIEAKFKSLKKDKKAAFIPFITAGDPFLKATKDLVLAFEKSGADIVELGVPFSDPLADGPTIQEASQRSLAKGTTLVKVFDLVVQIRKTSDIPIALMLYYNPIYHYGEQKFISKCKQVGVDGIIVPDLPPEEAKTLVGLAKKEDVSTIFFLSPTTTESRAKKNINTSSGFVYYVSIAGVTGQRSKLPASVSSRVKAFKKISSKPICVGFGVSSKEQVSAVAKVADGVIVGSAIVKEINKYSKDTDMVLKVARFVKNLSKGIK